MWEGGGDSSLVQRRPIMMKVHGSNPGLTCRKKGKEIHIFLMPAYCVIESFYLCENYSLQFCITHKISEINFVPKFLLTGE